MHTQKVGGIRFTRIGPLVISTSISFKREPSVINAVAYAFAVGPTLGYILGLAYNSLAL